MTFEEAIKSLVDNKKIARSAWSNSYVFLNPPLDKSLLKEGESSIPILMFASNGIATTNWEITWTDISSCDWEVVN